MKLGFKYFFLLSIGFLCNTTIFSQGEEDSLQLLLPFSKGEQRVDILNALSISQNESDTNKKIDFAKQALSISNKLNYTKGLAQTHIVFGLIDTKRKRFDLARTAFLNGLFLALKSNDLSTVGMAYNNLGNLYFLIGDYDKSLRYNEGALKIADQRFDTKNSAKITLEIGTLYFEMGDLDKATIYFLRSFKLYKNIKNELAAAQIEFKLATINQSKGYDLSALHYYMQCIEVIKKFASSGELSFVRNNIGKILLKRQQSSKALKILTESYKMDESLKDYYSITNSAINLSQTFLQMRKFDSAIYYCLKAFEIAKINTYRKEQLLSAEILISIFTLKNEKSKAIFYKNELLKIKSDLKAAIDEKSSKDLIRNEIENDKKRKYSINNSNVQTPEIQKNQFGITSQFVYYLIGSLLVIILSLLIIVLKLNKKRKNLSHSLRLNVFNKLNNEIRTPLNSIIGISHLASESRNLTELRQYLFGINQSCDDLLFQINNFNYYIQINSNSNQMVWSKFELIESLKLLIKSFEMECKQKGILFNSTFSNDIPSFVHSDKSMFVAIIQNLLNNAYKFSEKGVIKMDVRMISSNNKKSHKIQIKVSDEGKGIAEKKLNENNFGIGLFIVKHYAEKLNGKLEINKTEKGSDAIVSLELEAVIDRIELKEKIISLTNLEKKISLPLDILLVENNPLSQKVLQQILRKQNYKVTLANNGKEALSCLRQNNFNLILMEINLPIMNGMITTQHIRNDKEFECDNNLPIIAMSSNTDLLEMEHCFEMGFNEYFIKPINKDVLLKKIVALSNNYQSYLSKN